MDWVNAPTPNEPDWVELLVYGPPEVVPHCTPISVDDAPPSAVMVPLPVAVVEATLDAAWVVTVGGFVAVTNTASLVVAVFPPVSVERIW